MRFAAGFAALSAALALGACTTPDFDSFRAPDASRLFRPMSVSNFKEKALPPVGPEDLVDAGGRCAAAAAPAPPAADAAQPPAQGGVQAQEAELATLPSPIALDMSECDVVRRAGIAEHVDIGSDSHHERVATLTYLNGPRPGIYRFAAGRLKSMERAPEPPQPAKPAKRVKRAVKSKPALRQTVTVE